MPRKLRLEYPGACYHVINRGNYRTDVFLTEGAKAAFEVCLFETCAKSGWLLHAFVVMRNHFHLAVETPESNLCAGMQWLQATFANRFNRRRNERGHLFQGRYKALLVEAGEALGQVCDYIHLNPVRAGVVPVARLPEYRRSSYWYLNHPRRRPTFLHCQTALAAAGGLADTAAGRRSYADYLAWQTSDGPVGRGEAYVCLSKGWALGTAGFKQRLLQDHAMAAEARAWTATGARKLREAKWGELLAQGLRVAGKTATGANAAPKSAPWKLAVAAWMKARTQVQNRWLSQHLHLGAPAAFSRNLTAYRRAQQAEDNLWKQFTSISAT